MNDKIKILDHAVALAANGLHPRQLRALVLIFRGAIPADVAERLRTPGRTLRDWRRSDAWCTAQRAVLARVAEVTVLCGPFDDQSATAIRNLAECAATSNGLTTQRSARRELMTRALAAVAHGEAAPADPEARLGLLWRVHAFDLDAPRCLGFSQ